MSASWGPHAGEARRQRVRRREIDSIGVAEKPFARSRYVGVAVLPDDPVRARIDHDHAVVLVVVGEDVAVWERLRQRRLVQRRRSRWRVTPLQLAVAREGLD